MRSSFVFGLWLAVSMCACRNQVSRPMGGSTTANQTAPQPCASQDSDGDGLPDSWEVVKYRTNPLLPDSDGDGVLDSDWGERQEYTYSLRVFMEVALPVEDISQLNTVFQDARIAGRRGEVTELDVVLYEAAQVVPGVEKYLSGADCSLPSGRGVRDGGVFGEQMRQLAGVNGSLRERVQRMFAAVYSQTTRSVPFNAFYLRNDGGVVSIEPSAASLVSAPDVEPDELWRRELDAPTMWSRKLRGECTSSAVLGGAALSEIGVRSRLVLFAPVYSAASDLLKGVWDQRALRPASPSGVTGCVSHTAIEMVVDDTWLLGDEQRLRGSPVELGLGPLVQLRVSDSVTGLIQPQIWGPACAGWGRLDGTRNAYRIIHISDGWGPHVVADGLVGFGKAPPRSVVITDIFPFSSSKRPRFIPLDAVSDPERYYLAKAELGGIDASMLVYFYRCANKILYPFRFVRGYWNDYFLLEALEGSSVHDQVVEQSVGCGWLLRDSEFQD
ncbi:MAG: thrombospondin type 3 repeat-containing protein [Proteobacteria bacterium]|nr:thrombospondin type 3 repeat-containing protein [Pseudomonadota bacterium]